MLTRGRNDLRNYLFTEENSSTEGDGNEIGENTGINSNSKSVVKRNL